MGKSDFKPMARFSIGLSILVLFSLGLTPLTGCRVPARLKAVKPLPIDSSTQREIEYFHSRILTEFPADTIIANVCEEPPTQDEIFQQVMEASQAQRHPRKRIPRRTAPPQGIRTPCKGQGLFISGYRNVTWIKLSDTESVKILGRSFHDGPSRSDFAWMESSNGLMAYSRGHICGSIEFKYTKDTITAVDLVSPKSIDSSWHIVPVRAFRSPQRPAPR